MCLQQWMDKVNYAAQPDGGMLTKLVRSRSRAAK
jgi:hypothetical protein